MKRERHVQDYYLTSLIIRNYNIVDEREKKEREKMKRTTYLRGMIHRHWLA